MNVIIDTPGWSELLRRSGNSPLSNAVAELISAGNAMIIGPIRQEVLSGVRDSKQSRKLRDALRAFVDIPITREDYETAAQYFTKCRSQGIQGSHIDFLICAVSVRSFCAILTSDHDFDHYAKLLPITLVGPP